MIRYNDLGQTASIVNNFNIGATCIFQMEQADARAIRVVPKSDLVIFINALPPIERFLPISVPFTRAIRKNASGELQYKILCHI